MRRRVPRTWKVLPGGGERQLKSQTRPRLHVVPGSERENEPSLDERFASHVQRSRDLEGQLRSVTERVVQLTDEVHSLRGTINKLLRILRKSTTT